MLISPMEWVFVGYISLGLYIMMGALVESWSWPEYSTGIKVFGAIFAVLLWPLIFFIN